MEVKGDRERIKASWVSISRVEASHEDSSGSEEGDRLCGRPCIPLASQKQRWNHWKAHEPKQGEGAVYVSHCQLGNFYQEGLHLPVGGATASFFRLLLHPPAFLSIWPDPKRT